MRKNQKQKKEIKKLEPENDREVVLDALEVEQSPNKKQISTLSKLVQLPGVREKDEMKPEQKSENIQKKATQRDQRFEQKQPIFTKKKRTTERFWAKTIPFFIAIIILGLISFLQTGLYVSSTLRPIAQKIALAIHYPVAVVGTHIITFNDLNQEIKVLQAYNDAEIYLSSTGASFSHLALNKMIRDVYLEKGKKMYNVKVPNTVVEQAFVNLFGAQSDSSDARMISQLTLGLSPLEIKEQIIRPYLEKAAFSESLLNDQTIIQKQKTIAEQLQITLSQKPELFSDESQYPYLGVYFYELGYVDISTLSASYASLDKTDIGAVSEIFENSKSYTLFKVIEKLPQKEGSQTHYVSLQKIEIKKIDADLWIDSKLKGTHVVIFNPKLSWNESCRQVTEGLSCLSVQASQQATVSLDSLYGALTGTSSIFTPNFSN